MTNEIQALPVTNIVVLRSKQTLVETLHYPESRRVSITMKASARIRMILVPKGADLDIKKIKEMRGIERPPVIHMANEVYNLNFVSPSEAWTCHFQNPGNEDAAITYTIRSA